VTVEETEGFFAIDTVSAGEHLHRGPIAQSQLIVQPTDLGEFAGDLRVESYGIMVTALVELQVHAPNTNVRLLPR